MNTLPDLMRRLDRKLDIQRGLSLTYDDLALLVASGAYAKLQEANRQYLERQCREHVARTRSIGAGTMPSTQEKGETSKSSDTAPTESGSEALARAQRTLRLASLPSIANTSGRQAVNISRQQTGRAR